MPDPAAPTRSPEAQATWLRLREIIRTRSLLTAGEFRLASGRTSGFFFDMKKTMFDPEGASLIADAILAAIADEPVDAVGGLEMGAVPIVAAVCVKSWPQRPLHGFFVRKETKDHGTRQRIDGSLPAGARVIVFEDVTTTGGSALQAVNVVREQGCRTSRVITVVDRLEGARQNLRDHGLDLVSLFTRDDFRPE